MTNVDGLPLWRRSPASLEAMRPQTTPARNRISHADGVVACLNWVHGRTLTPPLSRGGTCHPNPAQLQIEYEIAADMLANLCTPDPRGRDYITGVHDALGHVADESESRTSSDVVAAPQSTGITAAHLHPVAGPAKTRQARKRPVTRISRATLRQQSTSLRRDSETLCHTADKLCTIARAEHHRATRIQRLMTDQITHWTGPAVFVPSSNPSI